MNANRKCKSADEGDTVSKNRRVHGYLARSGASNAIKTRIRRRERHTAKYDLKKGW